MGNMLASPSFFFSSFHTMTNRHKPLKTILIAFAYTCRLYLKYVGSMALICILCILTKLSNIVVFAFFFRFPHVFAKKS